MNRNHIIVSFLPLFLMCTSCQKTENVASSSSSESYEDHRTIDYFGNCSFHAHSFSDFQTLYQDFKNHNTLPILAFDFSSGEKIWETTYTLAGLGDRRLPLSEVELSGKVNFSFKAEWDDPENYFGGIFSLIDWRMPSYSRSRFRKRTFPWKAIPGITKGKSTIATRSFSLSV